MDAFTLHPGIKFRGVNISGRPNDTGNGNFGVPSNSYDLIYDWATGHESDPWNTWLKPQIDAMALLGCNLFRFLFDITARLGGPSNHGAATWRGTISESQLHTILDQMIVYLASKGMYFFPAATESRPFIDSGINDGTAINAYFADFAAFVSSSDYSNVIGLDVCQEWSYGGTSGNIIANNLGSLTSVSKAARDRLIPVTNSPNGVTGSAAGIASIIANALPVMEAAGCDWVSLHTYYFMSAGDFDALLANEYGFAVTLDETGIPFTGAFSTDDVTGSSAALRQDFHERIAARALEYTSDMQGFSVWSAAPNYVGNQSNDYGLLDGSFAPRTELTAPFQLIPATPNALSAVVQDRRARMCGGPAW